MIRSKHSGWLMPSHTYRESEDDRAIVRIACWATVVMTQKQSDRVCAPDIFWLFWQSVTLNTGVDSVDGDGSWNGRSPGSINFAVCACATKNEPTSMKPSCPLVVL